MKAIYEVTFYSNDGARDKVSDSRRKAGEASNRGFKNIAKWADEVCGKGEWVGSIKVLTTEHL